MDLLRQKLSLLPEKPGVYLLKDTRGQIIYVGKAKILRNRVRSYFTGSHAGKTGRLVSQIADFEYIITESEVEALVLECNLIKMHTPKYNILLRDDKTYPYLIITEENHPRILVTRQVQKGRGNYFGPYPNATAAKEAARLLNRLFPFRKCRQIPTRPCLYYHLEQCLAPCVTDVALNVYVEMRKDVSTFLKGDQSKIIKLLEDKMQTASEALHYERAREYRDLIEDLKLLREKQNITLNDFIDRDVIGYAITTDQMCIQVFYLRLGKLLARDSFIFPYYEEPEEAFISFVAQFYIER
ncbi:MAG: excinuclease ABC subunit UvrC, partial [Desulfosporosinus sp.]